MIVIDANVLIYAYDTRSPDHDLARRWLESVFISEGEVGIPFQSILAFIRVTTNRKLYVSPVSIADALAAVDTWLEKAGVRILTPGPTHWEIFHRLCLVSNASSNLTTDAHMATFAIEYDAVLYTADSDLARFPGLRWMNPLRPNPLVF